MLPLPEDPMENLWQRVRECHSFTLAGNDAITEAKTGVFANAARDWRKLSPLEQTWAKLQKRFKIANDERKRLLTSEGAGYHTDNAAQTSTAAQLEQALAALANKTAAANATTDGRDTSTPPPVRSHFERGLALLLVAWTRPESGAH